MNTTTPAGRLQGRACLVTGGGSGIGAAVSTRLAAEGALVAILDVDEQAGKRVAAALPPEAGAHFIRCDVTDPVSMEQAVAGVVARFGRLDIAVNNAGIGGVVAPIPDYPLDIWNRVIAANLSGVFHGLRAEIPVMAKQGRGAIVNIASLMGVVGSPGISAYVAAKHGVAGLTKVAALEWGEAGIRVNAVGPSFIKTPLTVNALPEEVWDTLPAMHALKRLAEPAEVAGLVAFLCSDDASYITGSLHLVDGGYTAL